MIRHGMDFHPDADRRALIADAFSRPLDALLPLSRLHRAEAESPWPALAELGVFGIAADPEIGGVGLGAAEEALLAMALGHRLADLQVLATLMAFHCADDATRTQIVSGATRVAPAILSDAGLCVIDGAGADWLLVRRLGGTALIPASMLSAPAMLDDGHWTARLTTGSLAAADLPWADLATALRVRLIEAAALCGVAACASEMAVAYAGFRQQFGQAIGGFQAVKHHCANMAMAAMAARDATTFAAMALEQDRADAAFQIESALLLAIDAALGNARRNVQVHGGIGFSDEADAHLVVKRAHLLVEVSGGGDAAAARIAGCASPMIHAGSRDGPTAAPGRA